MREMELGYFPHSFEADFGHWQTNRDGSMWLDRSLPLIATKLLGYALFPEDCEGRKAYGASMGILALGNTEKLQNEKAGYDRLSPEQVLLADAGFPAFKRMVEKKYFEEFGGFQTIMEATTTGRFNRFERENEKNAVALSWAGAILFTILRMAEFHTGELRGGPSVRKVIALFEATGGPAKSELMGMWSRYKVVAHLGAAAVYMRDYFKDSRFTGDRNEDFFGAFFYRTAELMFIAREFQEFATTYVPKRSHKGPLVDPQTVWKLPPAIFLRPSLVIKQPLLESEIQILSKTNTSSH